MTAVSKKPEREEAKKLFAKFLNKRSYRKGELTSAVEVSNASFAKDLSSYWYDSTDAGMEVTSEDLINPETGRSGIIALPQVIGVGGLNLILLGEIPDVKALNPRSFYVNLKKQQKRDRNGGGVEELRTSLVAEAEDDFDFLQGTHDDRIWNLIGDNLVPRLYKGRYCAIRVSIKDEAPIGDALARSVAFDGWLHPNVLASFARGKTPEGRPVQVVEYLPKVIDPNNIHQILDLRQIASVTGYTLDALMEIAARGAAHRDVKPENVLLIRDQNGEIVPKLADFDLVRIVERSFDSVTVTRDGLIKASPYWASPEHVNPKKYGAIDVKSDVYSLGATGYEWITGHHFLYLDDTMGDAERVQEIEEGTHKAPMPTIVAGRAPYDRSLNAWRRLRRESEIRNFESGFERILAGMTYRNKADRLSPERAREYITRLLRGDKKVARQVDIYKSFNNGSRRDIDISHPLLRKLF